MVCALLAFTLLSLAASHPSFAQTQTQAEAHVTLSYVLVGGGTPPAPILWFFSNGQNVSTTLSFTPTNYTMDSGEPFGVSKILPNSTNAQRWDVNGSNTDVATNQTMVFFYFRQYYATFGVPIIPNAGSFALPVVDYTVFGQNKSTLAGGSGWADYLSPYTYADIEGAQAGVRWSANSPTGVILNQFKIVPHYIEQFLTNFALRTQGPSKVQSVTLTAKAGGTVVENSVSASGATYWLDANTTLAFPSTLNSNSGSQRWVLHSVLPATATAPSNVTVTYFEQFTLSVSSNVSAGLAPSAPTVLGVANGQQFSQQMFDGSPPAWVDAESGYSVPNLLLGSTSEERWITFENTAGVATGPTTLQLEYFHQVLVNFSYSAVGGGTVAPTLSYYYRGSQGTTPVTASSNSLWADYGSSIAVQGAFQGQNPQERWELKSSPQMSLTGPVSLAYVYYHQYQFTITYNIPDQRQGISPVLSGFSFGLPLSSQSPSGASAWLDAGSPWSASPILQGVQNERWVAISGANGTVSSVVSSVAAYVHEYYLSVGANSPLAAELSQSGWFKAGGAVPLSASLNTGWIFEGWAGTGNGSYSGTGQSPSVTLSGPIQETASFDLTYSLRISGSGTVLLSFGSSSFTVGRNPVVLHIPPGTSISLDAQPGLLQSFSGWQGISGGKAEAVVITATSPTNVVAVFGINTVEAYGLIALYWGVAFYLIAYILWRRRPSVSGFLSKFRKSRTSYV